MNRRYPRYPDDADYQTNSPSYYEDLARKNKLIKELAKRIWEYDEKLDTSLKNIENTLNDYVTIIDGKIELIDNKIGEGFNKEINDLLVEWLNDGTLDHIINVTLMNKKPDITYIDNEVDIIDVKESQHDLESMAIKKQNENELNNIIRVATFNIWSIHARFFDLLHDTKNEILKSKTHVIGTQEMINGRYFNFDRDLTSKVYPYSHFFTSVEGHRYYTGHDFGNGLISALPILESSGYNYNMIDPLQEQRTFQRVMVRLNGVRIAIYNTHLTHNSIEERKSQLNELFTFVENDDIEHRIIIGDFNTDNIEDFSNFTNESYKIVNTGQYKTYPSTNRSIDNIIISSNLSIETSGMLEVPEEISDHNLLYADIKIN